MWVIALRDLQMRRRRFVVAVIAVGLVFGITLLLDGFTHSINNEIRRTVGAFHANTWLVSAGSSGPFTPDHLVAEAVAQPARTRTVDVSPVLALSTSISTPGGSRVRVNVIGTNEPVHLQDGRWPSGPHEVVANDDLGVGLGRSLTISNQRFKVVGRTAHLRYFAGTNVLFLPLQVEQRVFVYGQPLATGFVVHGPLNVVPHGLITMSNAAVMSSLRQPVKAAASTIGFLDILLWIVAAGIMGTILYMTSLERLRDFAALKAIGARNSQVFSGIAVQALVLSIAAGLLAWIVSRLLAPVFPMIVEIPLRSYPLTLAVAIAVGLLGSVAGVRKAMATDPALAFGG
jgi:putative ABC transport system permease protein